MKIYTNEDIKEKLDKKEKRKKIIKFAFLPFIILIVLFVGDILFQKFIQKKNSIEFFGFRPLIVMTGSMESTINIGDMIIVNKIPQSNIKIGDVITYMLENGKDTITHRVIDIVEKDGELLYQTKGDNNNSPDPDLVRYSSIVGAIKFKISGIGKLIAYIFTGTGLFAMALIVIIHYAISNDRITRDLAREEARRLYNIPKYKKKEETL